MIAAFLSALAILFSGNYDTGDFSQYNKLLQGSDGDCCVVGSFFGHATAARFTVEPGDRYVTPITGVVTSGDRAEVSFSRDWSTEGETDRWTWQTYFPQGFRADPAAGRWNTFTQWHHDGSNCTNPISLAIDARTSPDWIVIVQQEAVSYATCTFRTSTLPLVRFRTGRWYSFDVTIHWSSNPAWGWMRVRLNNKLVLPRWPMATLYPGFPNFFKQGWYWKGATWTNTVYHDGTTMSQG